MQVDIVIDPLPWQQFHVAGKRYLPEHYCLDYSVDYCSGIVDAELRAIIHDPGKKE